MPYMCCVPNCKGNYHNGPKVHVFGFPSCSYSSQKLATSAFVFIIQSILSDYKDVVHVVPVHKLSAADLHVLIKKTVKGLEIVGFRVICVVTDNNAINGRAMSFF